MIADYRVWWGLVRARAPLEAMPTQNFLKHGAGLAMHICKLLTFKMCVGWAFLVAQWLRIRLPMQETRVRALVREDPTCRGATKSVRHNY